MPSRISAPAAAYFLATPAIILNKPSTLSRQVEEAILPYVNLGSRLLIAVSGGADSVALAHLLKSLNFRLTLAHVDHQLRRHCARDARFVQQLAQRWDIPFLAQKVDVKAAALKNRWSIEDAARRLRYASLEVMAGKARCRAIVTAHHADDQSETVLFNFLRGTGANGLAGMSVCRAQGKTLLLRPLLNVSRQTLRRYLRKHRLSFRSDPSNKNTAFSRNRLRLKTLPLLSKDFPGLPRRLIQMAAIFREEEAFWALETRAAHAQSVRWKGRTAIVDLKIFLGYHESLGRRIFHSLLPGVSYQAIGRLMNLAATSNETARVAFSGGFLAFRKSDQLFITVPQGRKHLQRNL